MNVDLTHLSVFVSTTALSVAVLHAARDRMLRAYLNRRRQGDGDSSRRAGVRTAGSGPAGGVPAGRPAGGSAVAAAGGLPQAGTQDARTPEGDASYDPRPQEDAARRRLAYHLVMILAVMLFSLLAMVGFGVVAVEDVEKFGVIVAPVVTLVTAATSFYYANRRGGK